MKKLLAFFFVSVSSGVLASENNNNLVYKAIIDKVEVIPYRTATEHTEWRNQVNVLSLQLAGLINAFFLSTFPVSQSSKTKHCYIFDNNNHIAHKNNLQEVFDGKKHKMGKNRELRRNARLQQPKK